MLTVRKTPGRDFRILNLTDIHLRRGEMAENHPYRRVFEYTLSELLDRVSPDLITVTGDISWAGDDAAHALTADILDATGIPWAPIWGNHDVQLGYAYIDAFADDFLARKNCLFEKGDPALGSGNYVVAIEENGVPRTALFMMDTHAGSTYIGADGKEHGTQGRLNDAQIAWFRANAADLKSRGCTDAALFVHIPPHVYGEAERAAFPAYIDWPNLQYERISDLPFHNPGWESVTGVELESVACPCIDDGVYTALADSGIAKAIVAGHDHINNWIIPYHGITLCYGLKITPSSYWRPYLNGGTVLCVTDAGLTDIHHEYVNAEHLWHTWH